jgi:glycerol kinase
MRLFGKIVAPQMTCLALKNLGHEAMVQKKTGLLLDPYFSATKLAWILDNVSGVRARLNVANWLWHD